MPKVNFKNRDIISIRDLSRLEIMHILKTAKVFKSRQHPNLLKNRAMAALFFEPSTRTRLSFEMAMQRLGGSVIGFAEAGITSVIKGESVYDSVRIIGQYADVIVIRHPTEGAARLAAEATDKPVLNGGDGANQHPTQTLLDMFTIWETQKKLNNLSVAMVGDLKYGRTVHSLASALKFFKTRLFFVAPDELQMPEYILRDLDKHGIQYSLHQTISSVVKKVDILYVTRIQKERFPDIIDYERVKNIYVLTTDLLQGVKKNLKIMHPLPRVNEIDVQVDQTPHAYYFEQANNGLFVRQAVLALVLGKKL